MTFRVNCRPFVVANCGVLGTYCVLVTLRIKYVFSRVFMHCYLRLCMICAAVTLLIQCHILTVIMSVNNQIVFHLSRIGKWCW